MRDVTEAMEIFDSLTEENKRIALERLREIVQEKNACPLWAVPSRACIEQHGAV